MLIPIPVAATAISPTCLRLRPGDDDVDLDGACASSFVVVVVVDVVVDDECDGHFHDWR
jgi:hypothetical protein